MVIFMNVLFKLITQIIATFIGIIKIYERIKIEGNRGNKQ